jgi:hypothetical protein
MLSGCRARRLKPYARRRLGFSEQIRDTIPSVIIGLQAPI